MGKQKIEQLLEQLQNNHSQDIQNAAAIFTVAQGAVNQLNQLKELEGLAPEQNALPAAPISLTKADLESRYGKFNACRAAAKRAGITFSKTPSWSQLIAAFSYLDACQSCVKTYLQRHPCADLKGVRLSITLGN